MATDPKKPMLRPVEVFPTPEAGREMLVVVDPAGWATDPIAVSSATVLILSLMDGHHDLEGIRRVFRTQTGQTLPMDQLEKIVVQLDKAYYLDSPAFRAYLLEKERAYREAPARRSQDAASFGVGDEGLGAMLASLLAETPTVRPKQPEGRLAGIVAPHLDYARGRPCYADVYRLLSDRDRPPRRIIILGTNHFGSVPGAVATRKDFETPLGVTRTDRAYIDALNDRLGTDLCTHEFDHQREHSVELQVILLQHVLGPENFTIVPVLCSDPNAPPGPDAPERQCVDVRAFAETLGCQLREDIDESDQTLIVAGADLSHVGARFGDDQELEADFRSHVERLDRAALEKLVACQSDEFLEALADHDNSTRICSAGCLFAAATALSGARPELLRYHQAIDADSQTGVTCASMAFWAK